MESDSGPSAVIQFYKASGPYGCFSNLWPHPLVFEDREYRCSEYAYQFVKPNKPEIAEWLMAAPHPRLCAAAAHALLGYDVNPRWQQIKVPRMRSVLVTKLDTYPREVGSVLVGTGDAQLIEASGTDAFWGAGARGTGQNMLGLLWMEWRARLVAELLRAADIEQACHRLWLDHTQGTLPF
jgi:ribA/ribD-fused uncharacterized protein